MKKGVPKSGPRLVTTPAAKPKSPPLRILPYVSPELVTIPLPPTEEPKPIDRRKAR